MAKWAKGEADVDELLRQNRLERVPADLDTSDHLVATAKRHVESARLTAGSDLEGALSLAYDAARKAATALLAHQGLRPTTTGGHIAVVEAMQAQFGDLPGLKSIDRIRRRRNQSEYPDPAGYAPVVPDEVSDAIEVAVECIEKAEALIATGKLGVY